MPKNGIQDSIPLRVLAELRVRHLANLFIAASTFVVLGATLYPFDFTTEDIQKRWAPFISPKVETFRSEKEDVVTNIFLFIPVGVSVAILAGRRRKRFTAALASVVAVGACFSLSIELAQLFLPFRYASLVDVASNTAGAVCGFVLYSVTGRYFHRVLTRAVERGNEGYASGWLVAAYAVYLLGVLFMTSPLQQSSFLNEFNRSTYPLVVGNEPTGDRPWSGVIRNVIITRNVLSRDGVANYLATGMLNDEDARMIVAHYVFEGSGPYYDGMRLNPPLEWRGTDTSTRHEALITEGRWLQTLLPAREVSSWITETRRFTVCFSAANVHRFFADNARIISVSPHAHARNFSVGQAGYDLVFRYRSMTTGINGTNPQFVVPDVFADTTLHRIVVSLGPTQLDVYVDGVDNHYSVELGPGFALLNRTFPFRGMLDISSAMKNFHNYFYWAIAFMPLAYLLGLVLTQSHMPVLLRLLITLLGIVAPPFLVEYELRMMTGRDVIAGNIALSITLMTGTAFLTWLYHTVKPGLLQRAAM